MSNPLRRYILEKYSIKILSTPDEIEFIRPYWEKWQWHPFRDFGYYHLCNQIEKGDPRPCLLVLYQNGSPVALLAGRIRQHALQWRIAYLKLPKIAVQQLEFGYGGLLGEINDETSNLLIQELFQSFRKIGVDIVYFDHLKIESPFFQTLHKIIPWYCKDIIIDPNPHWVLDLPNSFDEFYKQCSSNAKSNIRKYKNRIQKEFGDKVQIHLFTKTTEIETAMEHIEHIASKTYQRGLGAGFQNTEETRQKWLYFAENGILRNYVLYIDESPMAFWNFLLYKDVICSIATGYLPEYHYYHPGYAILMHMIEEMCAHPECHLLDYGFGEAAYKKRYGTETWLESHQFIFAPTLKGIRLQFTRTIITWISNTLKQIMSCLRIADWLKKKWRNRLSKRN